MKQIQIVLSIIDPQTLENYSVGIPSQFVTPLEDIVTILVNVYNALGKRALGNDLKELVARIKDDKCITFTEHIAGLNFLIEEDAALEQLMRDNCTTLKLALTEAEVDEVVDEVVDGDMALAGDPLPNMDELEGGLRDTTPETPGASLVSPETSDGVTIP